MTISQPQIDQCIEVYERITGFTNGRGLCANVIAWSEYLRSGFTADDLSFVLTHLMREIKRGERRLGCLRISTLILDTQRFSEELNLARAMERNRKPPPSAQERVVEQFRRTPPPRISTDAKPIAEYIKALREAAG